MDPDDLAFGLDRHADLIAAGELSSRELIELFPARIEVLRGWPAHRPVVAA